jgi:hypothetical protein
VSPLPDADPRHQGGLELFNRTTCAHFRLGEASRADRIDIFWPSGRTETLRDVAARQIVTVGEGRDILRATPFVR